MFIFLLPPEFLAPKHKTRQACCAGGPKSALFSGSLCTPQQARHGAVMMMVPMRPKRVYEFHREN
jgi:hypothetical protein